MYVWMDGWMDVVCIVIVVYPYAIKRILYRDRNQKKAVEKVGLPFCPCFLLCFLWQSSLKMGLVSSVVSITKLKNCASLLICIIIASRAVRLDRTSASSTRWQASVTCKGYQNTDWLETRFDKWQPAKRKLSELAIMESLPQWSFCIRLLQYL